MNAKDVHLAIRRLDAAEAEIWVTAPEPVTGRLLGPRCRYASTVEVAHYLKPLPPGAAAPPGTQRIIVPEPSLWEPQTPFLYRGIFQAGAAKIEVPCALRTLQLDERGLRLNRKPFRVRGAYATPSPDYAALRAAGLDTLVCPVTPEYESHWESADSSGFFVIGVVTRDPASVSLAESLKHHPSSLGWLLDDFVDLEEPERLQVAPRSAPFLGVLLRGAPGHEPPAWLQFLAGPAGPEGKLAAYPTGSLPTLAIGADDVAHTSLGLVTP